MIKNFFPKFDPKFTIMGSVVIIVSTIMILSIIINYFLLIDDAEKEIDLKLDTLLELSSKGLEGPFWNYDYETAEDFAMGILKDQDVFKVELLDALDNKVVSFQKSRFLPKDLIIRETKIYKGPQIIGLCRIGIDGQYRKNKVPVILTRNIVLSIVVIIVLVIILFFQKKTLFEYILKLEENHKQLMESEKMASLGALVAGIAHEINTPLGVSVTAASRLEALNNKYISLLKSGKMRKEDLVDYMNKIMETTEILQINLNKGSELISSFKKIAVDRSHDLMDKIDIKDYVDKIILSLRHEYKRSKHTIINNLPSITINTYPGRISQIFTNLFINSFIHGFENIEEGTIEINGYVEDNQLIIQFSDNGVGIPKEHLSQIFNPFFTTKRGSGGSGLGLNLVYNLVVTKLNGTITCQSTQFEGTTFTIKIPLNLDKGSDEHTFKAKH
ncbi:MAG: HAMP domain-containing histidine kinase [Epulopiscium sp.]|nr:HAMP domain-containing histidine kinase [Candidatus Epulonipiscium sp.]